MEVLYLQGTVVEGKYLLCPVDTAIALFLWDYCGAYDLQCYILEGTPYEARQSILKLPYTCLSQLHVQTGRQPILQRCTLPSLQSGCIVRTGLCAVLRHIVKYAHQRTTDSSLISLLGNKGICLKACAEVSVWTKFCEIEVPDCIHHILKHEDESIPTELLKLENHFTKPPIVRSINKRPWYRKRQQSMKTIVSDPTQLEHVYAEGTDMTLTDLILYPCITYFLEFSPMDRSTLGVRLPLLWSWYRRMGSLPRVQKASQICGLPSVEPPEVESSTPDRILLKEEAAVNSLLDVRTEKKKVKAHLASIQQVIKKLMESDVEAAEEIHPCGTDVKLAWESLPLSVHPMEGELPSSRIARKCEQLENLGTAVKHLARPGDTIVDFCSGGGHLGILLAHLLPSCHIILVENKEESLLRAQSRIEKLGFTNIDLYQCNMDYFNGDFDIGVCLHACGVATDLVLNRCLQSNASFVICPCCYGGIQNTHTVLYPRSKGFKNKDITYQDYLVLGHAADQTEFGINREIIGKTCMLYIDTDRMLLAKEHGYDVTLCSLQPLSCSPKNDLLIGRRPDSLGHH